MVLPDFDTSRWVALTVCGHLPQPATLQAEALAKIGTAGLTAILRPKGQKAVVVRVVAGESEGEPESHLHIEILRKEYFDEQDIKALPKRNTTMKEVRRLVGQFLGVEFVVRVSARYLLDFEHLPESGLIQLSGVDISKGGFQVRQTAATFSFSQGPFYRMSWSLVNDRRKVRAELAGKWRVTVTDDYLANIRRFVDSAFRGLTLGEEPNAKA